MDVDELEREANAAALKQVAAMLQRPDQLHKIHIFTKKAVRKQAAVDAMLKTAVQLQLEGVRTGIQQLSTTGDDVRLIEQSLTTIWETVEKSAPMKERLSELRDESMKQRQYVAAIDNLKHIYNVPATLEQTHKLIEDNCLLHAHKNLMDLERARDELMLELHRLPERSEHDLNQLNSYFAGVPQVVDELGKQVFYIISRCLEAVRGADPGPQQVVTALRIVEQQERIDDYIATNESDHVPKGRPRGWREKVFDTLSDVVRQRIEGNQLEDRSLNKQWLARYLEVCRRVTLDDLKVAQCSCPPCFPPEYYIYDRYVRMYHGAIVHRLAEIADDELEKNELVQLLSWVHEYSSPSMFGKPSLNIEVGELLAEEPLLAQDTLRSLYERYMLLTTSDVNDWMTKTLETEKDDWYNCRPPERDSLRYAYTSMPSILFQMVEDQVTLAKEITVLLVPDVVMAHVTAMITIADAYNRAMHAFKSKHFEDRSRFRSSFTQAMVAASNNGDSCVELSEKATKHVRLTTGEGEQGGSLVGRMGRSAMLDEVDTLKGRWREAGMAALRSLYEEWCRDVAPHMAEIMSRKWLSSASQGPCSIVCETVRDYCNDYMALRPPLAHTLLMNIHMRCIFEYLQAMQSRRTVCSSEADRTAMGRQLRADGKLLHAVFDDCMRSIVLDSTAVPSNDAFLLYEALSEILPSLAEVVELGDKHMLPLIVTSFVRKYADVTAEQLTGFVSMRDDLSRGEAKMLADDALHTNRIRPPCVNTFTRLFNAKFWPDNIERGSTTSTLINKAKETTNMLKEIGRTGNNPFDE